MKKYVLFMLAGIMVFTASCGQTGKNENPPTESVETESEISDSTDEATLEKEESKEDTSEPYAVEKELKFGSFSPLSMDYLLAVYNTETFDEIDDSDFHIVDKGEANYTFYDIKTWPAEKEGYTTAKLTYTVDKAALLYLPEQMENKDVFESIETIKLFDYYTGRYIPDYKNRSLMDVRVDTTMTGENIETEIEYHGMKWDLTSRKESSMYDHTEYEYADARHCNYTIDRTTSISLYVTYPDDYDGLSFAIRISRDWKYDKENIKKDKESAENEDIGKDILSTFEDTEKEDILFFTMKDGNSVKAEPVASGEEAEIPSFEERFGITEYADASMAKGFSLPFDFYVFGENEELLGEDMVKSEKGTADYKIKEVKAENPGDETKITISYSVNKTINVSFVNYDGEFSGCENLPVIWGYDSITGGSVIIKEDCVEDNSDWGEWKDDSNISYNIDKTYKAEFTLPTDRIDYTIINFGDPKESDSVRFKLSELL